MGEATGPTLRVKQPGGACVWGSTNRQLPGGLGVVFTAGPWKAEEDCAVVRERRNDLDQEFLPSFKGKVRS